MGAFPKQMSEWLRRIEERDEMGKLLALDRLSREPQHDKDDSKTRLADLREQRDMLVQSAKHIYGTALELSIMISVLEESLSPSKKLAKVHRKRIAKRVAELEAVCNRRPDFIAGFSAA